tara:strand:- start:116666 stop:118996 length:2331 start_codon:yes stop_codon:yes gene_type:complete
VVQKLWIAKLLLKFSIKNSLLDGCYCHSLSLYLIHSVLSNILQLILRSFKELKQFLKSGNFSKSILIVIAITIPLAIGLWLNHIEIGLALCFGAFWSSPSDVNGSQKHKVFGILFSAALVMVVSFIGGYLHYETWLSLFILGIASFAIAFLSTYGFRASLISFSGLLALVLSFAHNPIELEIYQYALLIGVGGLWYLLLSTLWYRLNPKGQTEETLFATIGFTSELIEIRGKLIDKKQDRSKLQSDLFVMQSELTEQHETLREILIQSRKTSGKSDYKGKRLLVLVQLVEMLETAIANPINYDNLDVLFEKHPEFIDVYQDLTFEMARQLKIISEIGNKPKKLPKNNSLILRFENVQNKLSALMMAKDYEGYIMFQNLLDYQEKQFEKLKRIKWLLGNPIIKSEEFIDNEVSRRFVISQDYNYRLLVRNLSLRSNIFRHSLRLAVTLMIGFALGNIFSFQNPYWILLTIIVIMRPNYGLTKTRSKDRIIGTLIGGAIATGLVYLIQDAYVYGALALFSLVIALSMVQRNYKASATFITLSIIFIYAILQPDVLLVIQYRVLDTVIGAGLSYLGILWLWPSWGFLEIKKDIAKSVDANRHYLSHIKDFYNRKGKVPTSYKLTRKNAFVETSNLSTAFQRMTQEPHSKQKNLNKIYELVELNHNFLSSLASLSTYIQHQSTTDASEKFNAVISKIDENLSRVLQSLNSDKSIDEKLELEDVTSFENQLPKLESKSMNLNEHENTEMKRHRQEEQLVREQLRWLFSLSSNMLKVTSNLK